MTTRQKTQQLKQKPETTALLPSDLQLLSITQTMGLLHLGRTKVYDLINTEGLPTTKIGGSTRVQLSKLKIWIEQRETTKSA